jgi:cold shock CspA family protein
MGTRRVFDLQTGVVHSYDFDRGLGTIVADSASGSAVTFHCTAIVDGSRRIDPGTRVAFVVGPAGPGRWEARQVCAIERSTTS